MEQHPETYRISIIIVNYNVAFFLDQCLDSVKKALVVIPGEIIVVDNASKDDSIALIKSKHPNVKLIANSENVGFSKANNQAIQISKGEWVLLLNPDTVVAEDTLVKCLEFVTDKPNCGALGIHMINGKGEFLPESKRGLPTPLVAFYKLSGLSKLFKRSKHFNQYHAGHIKENESAPTTVLSGAFMMIRKEALEKVGLLDESFFMYGEDIDLSYRIILGGYSNYYFAGSSIIHYKGESTKKSSVNYVFVFYRAMMIFAKKHFGKKHASIFSLFINIGIYLRASAAVVSRIIKRLFLPATDLFVQALGLILLSNYWQMAGIQFPDNAFKYLIPSYSLIWVFSGILNGIYDQPSILRFVRSAFLGTITILVAYALLPKDWQFSRLFILLGTIWIIFYLIISRLYIGLITRKKLLVNKKPSARFLIVGSDEDALHVRSILENSQVGISEIVQIHRIDNTTNFKTFNEVILCAGSNSYATCISEISRLRVLGLEFKIAPKGRNYLIGSNSIDTAGDVYILELNQLAKDENKRKKRLVDLSLSLTLILTSPILCFMFKDKKSFFVNLWNVFIGKSTFVGFTAEDILKDHRLPKTKNALLNPGDEYAFINEELSEKIKLLYARDYSTRKDLRIIFTAFKKLDRK